MLKCHVAVVTWMQWLFLKLDDSNWTGSLSDLNKATNAFVKTQGSYSSLHFRIYFL